jgi:hypothetical protein
MTPKNIHDPLFEPEICAWESASGQFDLAQELCGQIDAEDVLKRRGQAERILQRLKDEDCPPALGIYGGWGTGKTSVLNLLKLINEVDQLEPTLHIERIDAWKYEGAGNLFVPVVATLKRMAGSLRDAPAWYASAKRVLTVTALASLSSLAKQASGLGLAEIQELYAQTEENSLRFKWENLTDEIRETEKAFQKLVEAALPRGGQHRLVLCIDNLDRCAPENVVGLLESVKNFVGVENCVWVFAMDSGVVASYINRKYAGTSMDGNSYLDKIIPEQVHLSLIVDQFGTEIRPLLQKAANGKWILDQVNLPQIPQVLVPRRLIKSVHKLAQHQASAAQSGVRPELVFYLILLYHSWPDFYERLSASNEEHVGAVLANFFKQDNAKAWEGHAASPLDPKFIDNQELKLFLKQTLPAFQLGEISLALNELKQIGLP